MSNSEHASPDRSPCFDCGAPSVHDHHVVPRSLGGTATVPLCGQCHGKAHGGVVGFRDTKQLTIQKLADIRASGKRTGNVRYGYSALPDGTLVPNESEMKTIAFVKHLRGEGVSISRIMPLWSPRGTQPARVGRLTKRPSRPCPRGSPSLALEHQRNQARRRRARTPVESARRANASEHFMTARRNAVPPRDRGRSPWSFRR